jgi:hypothetical protein
LPYNGFPTGQGLRLEQKPAQADGQVRRPLASPPNVIRADPDAFESELGDP